MKSEIKLTVVSFVNRVKNNSNSYLTTHHEFHHQEKILFIFVDIVELDDVGMVNLFENIYFIL